MRLLRFDISRESRGRRQSAFPLPPYRRRFCLNCSPFGLHNTSKTPPGANSPEELREQRRRKRNAKTYRYQKRRRRALKAALIAERGGRCESCGYHRTAAALEFHHRDPVTKEFGLGSFSGSEERMRAEADKCDLLCANCHRLRHHPAEEPSDKRQQIKLRALRYLGGECVGCGRGGPLALLEFHHTDASEKEFGISQGGTVRRWDVIVTELAKCVLLCANCHREVHAGVREIDEGLLGLAEDERAYTIG